MDFHVITSRRVQKIPLIRQLPKKNICNKVGNTLTGKEQPTFSLDTLHRCMELIGGLADAHCFAALQHEDLLGVDFLQHRLLVLLLCIFQGTGSSNRFLMLQYGFYRQGGFQFLQHTSSSAFHLSIITFLKQQNLFVLDFKYRESLSLEAPNYCL